MLFSQIAWQVVDVAAMYSTSDVDKVVVAYFFELQYITPDPRVKICVEMFHLSYNEPT